MPYRCFNLDLQDNIAHLELKRGEELNTMVPEFWHELPAILADIDSEAKARVIVISSTGQHFSAGMDLSVFASNLLPSLSLTPPDDERGRLRANLRHSVRELQQSFSRIERIRQPVLVAIQGGCIGGALDFVTACDCRYASEDAFFQIQEVNIGVTADLGTFPRLCRLMPEGMVREMAYTGRRLPARTALALGLINDIFPTQEAMLDHVMAVARDIAANSPLAVHGSKVMINYARDHSIADSLDYVATWQAGMYNAETDLRLALEAKQAKRAPQFADLLPLEKSLVAK